MKLQFTWGRKGVKKKVTSKSQIKIHMSQVIKYLKAFPDLLSIVLTHKNFFKEKH